MPTVFYVRLRAIKKTRFMTEKRGTSRERDRGSERLNDGAKIEFLDLGPFQHLFP